MQRPKDSFPPPPTWVKSSPPPPPPPDAFRIKKRDLSHLTQEELDEYSSQGITLLYDFGGTIIKRRGNIVTKAVDKIVAEVEPCALAFAAQLGLPVPRLHDVVMNSDHVEINMSYIEGDPLEKVWPTLSPEEKQDICRQLRDILDVMRKAEWTTGLIGSCDKGIARDCRRFCSARGGPFPNEEAFNEFVLDLPSITPTPIRDMFTSRQGSNHRIVFTHGDLHQNNIMVKDKKITGLLDWEFAGWYPEYWEYVKFIHMSADHRDWKNYAKDIFPQLYQDELLFSLALSVYQRG